MAIFYSSAATLKQKKHSFKSDEYNALGTHCIFQYKFDNILKHDKYIKIQNSTR